MVVEARSGGQQKIPVHIFPCRMNDAGMKALEAEYAGNPTLISFWKNIQNGYAFFEEKKEIPAISISQSGEYLLR